MGFSVSEVRAAYIVGVGAGRGCVPLLGCKGLQPGCRSVDLYSCYCCVNGKAIYVTGRVGA
jgi:hypothetical protein